MIFDPPLTTRGLHQCQELEKELTKLLSKYMPEYGDPLIAISPLTRALQTAMLGLPKFLKDRLPPVQLGGSNSGAGTAAAGTSAGSSSGASRASGLTGTAPLHHAGVSAGPPPAVACVGASSTSVVRHVPAAAAAATSASMQGAAGGSRGAACTGGAGADEDDSLLQASFAFTAASAPSSSSPTFSLTVGAGGSAGLPNCTPILGQPALGCSGQQAQQVQCQHQAHMQMQVDSTPSMCQGCQVFPGPTHSQQHCLSNQRDPQALACFGSEPSLAPSDTVLGCSMEASLAPDAVHCLEAALTPDVVHGFLVGQSSATAGRSGSDGGSSVSTTTHAGDVLMQGYQQAQAAAAGDGALPPHLQSSGSITGGQPPQQLEQQQQQQSSQPPLNLLVLPAIREFMATAGACWGKQPCMCTGSSSRKGPGC
jgi:hypothetical protein